MMNEGVALDYHGDQILLSTRILWGSPLCTKVIQAMQVNGDIHHFLDRGLCLSS